MCMGIHIGMNILKTVRQHLVYMTKEKEGWGYRFQK